MKIFLIFGVFTILVGAIAFVCVEGERVGKRLARQDQQTYSAWCKLTHRTDITYSEWVLLKRQGLLKP